MPLSSNQILAVYGEFDVPFEKQQQVKQITGDSTSEFIKRMNGDEPGLLDKMGVYVFCIRASGGILPWYVGRTKRSLEKEIFDSDKLVKYNKVLFARKRGKPCFYFLAPKSRTGKQVSSKYLPLIEELMIVTAYNRNRELVNIKSKSGSQWCIDGIRGGEGNERELTQIESDFCSMMGLKPDKRQANKE